MAQEFTYKFNTRTGQWNLIPTNIVLAFKAGVAAQANLPLTGNSKGDARIANDTGHLYVWSIIASSGLLTDWADAGDVVDLTWAAISGKPSSTPANIDSAVSLKHTQGTDQGLDTGGANATTAADVKDAVTKKHSQNTDHKIIDADNNTSVEVEETPDEDVIHLKINGVKIGRVDASSIWAMGVYGYVLADIGNPSGGIGFFYQVAGALVKLHTAGYGLPIEIDGSEIRLQTNTTGKVGIGVSSPAEKLDVLGNIKVSGNITDGVSSVAPSNIAKKHIEINEPALGSGIDNYTLVLADDGKLIDMNEGVACTLTIPKNSVVGFPIGTTIALRQKGAGQITITPVDGTVIINNPDGLKTIKQYSMASLIKVDTNTWSVIGRLEV